MEWHSHGRNIRKEVGAMKNPSISKNFTLKTPVPPIVDNQFGSSLSDTTDKDWTKFFMDDLSKKLEPYHSSIPQNILSRPEHVHDMMASLGVERVDLPKMPNGKHIVWWYFLQFKSCIGCIYLSEKNKEPLKRKCLNPKITKPQFLIYASSMDTCPHWRAGYDENLIEEQKAMGSSESAYIWASLVALGICDKPSHLLLPMVGIPQILRATPEVIHATELHNKIIYNYLQLYYLKQAGHKIDDEDISSAPLENLPVIKAENFDTNVVQFGVVM